MSASPIFSISFMKPFTDGKTLMEKLAASHDNRLEKIKNRESQLIERLSTWKLDLLKEVEPSLQQISNLLYFVVVLHISYSWLSFLFLQIKDKHIKQNQFRMTCIFAYVKHFKDQLEELQ